MQRRVFFISDRTGITAEIFGQALLSQFEGIHFKKRTLPYIDTEEKALEVQQSLNHYAEQEGVQPIVFDTIVMPDIRRIVRHSDAIVLDFFHTYIGPLEDALGVESNFRVGRTHSIDNKGAYDHRIEAVNFALNNDDGGAIRQYEKADIILVGVSRCGKTPTCLYLAMQFGILAANYPFTEEDIEQIKLPASLKKYQQKIFGLTINAQRLHEIRTERKANSRYASLKQCQFELREVEGLYRKQKIPFLNTTSKSIEEIATKILAQSKVKRRQYG